MPHPSQSRDVLTAMEFEQDKNPSLSFSRGGGYFVTRNIALVLAIFFLSSLLATGLLVYYYATPARAESYAGQTKTLESPMEATSSDVRAAEIFDPSPPSPMMKNNMTMLNPSTMVPKAANITDVRLPTSVKPVRYLVRLQPLVNGNFSILGYIEITIEVLEATKNVTLHMTDIITKNDTITLKLTDDLSGSGVGIVRHKYDTDREFYVAMLDQELMAGKQYVLTMEFEGLLNDKLKGFYRSQYTDEQGNTKMLAATQFQATHARKAFPCFDEPALKAEFEVYLARQTNMSAISNMPKIETTPLEGQPGWVWDHFNTSVPMSSYLVAFVVSDFTYINSTSNDHVFFKVWARNQAINQAQYSNRIGPDILTWFEGYFDLPFPLPKQDMIAIPDFSAGAMENWGLITYRETALLYDPAVSAAVNKQRVAAVVSHELAHQWFGNLVTPSWWTDLWLNEGFASYVEYLGMNAVEPTWKVLEQFVIDDLYSALSLDCLESSHPISIPVGHPSEIGQIFDTISYKKGASIIRMMNHFLGEPTFRKGLTNYLKYFKYNSTEQDDLWRFLTEQAHRDGKLRPDLSVKTIMDTWTLQMGYPVITVQFKGDGTAVLSQKRFLVVKNPNSTDTHDYKWWVPISFTSEDAPDFNSTGPSVWMASSESSKVISGLPSADKWTILNVQQTGYYRVNYDENNWKMIIRQLKSDHKKIGVINRAQMIDDALDLARAGQLSYNVALDVISFLGTEVEYVPWKSALGNLGYLKNMLSRTGIYGAFKRYLLSLLVPLYESVGFHDNVDDPHLDQLKRVNAVSWACSLDHEDCVQNAVRLFQEWMTSPANKSIISPNLKSTVFCTAIREGREKEWNFAWKQYEESNVASEKASLIYGLGCTKETWILTKYMGMAFTAGSGVRKQDSSSVFGRVARNEHGRDLAWNYLKTNWHSIVQYFDQYTSPLRHIVKSASMKFSSSYMKDELRKFSEEHSDSLKNARRTVDQSIERTGNNEAWLSAHYPVIVKWLKDNGYDNSVETTKGVNDSKV